ncbi:unnamed protein product [Vitrella brassicaformis CCMP3155]|uniref:TLDc domain-containing protein n=1 Tax=Vitrella brassicaformis (strain CCMP3155) TaxID=1169540 RepID=A0A0G4GTJ2_VITBC|nr:unnamed protein product [Vitrella brassicaformis CCMP3155]|eukprot:CEM34081.1 unnamed protein product [Vitrella brassicaformis CCMP3155]
MAPSPSSAAAVTDSKSPAKADDTQPCGHKFHFQCTRNRICGLPSTPSAGVPKCSGLCKKEGGGGGGVSDDTPGSQQSGSQMLTLEGCSLCMDCVVQRIGYGPRNGVCPLCRAARAWAIGGSSIGLSDVAHIAKWLGGASLTLIYRASRDGTGYDDLLRCVGDKLRLVFIIRKGRYVFGAFISGGLHEPRTRPAAVGRPAEDIRSCHQWTSSAEVPEGYTGERQDDIAVLGGSLNFVADELEVLQML